MKTGSALALAFGTMALGAAAILGFAQANEEKISECSPPGTPVTAEVVKWRLTGGYGLAIVNADNRVAYAENSETPEPLQKKAAQFCRDQTLRIGLE